MKKLAVIFGGKSTENEISLKSAMSVLNNLDKRKYEIFSIFIDKNGDWFNFETNQKLKNITESLKSFDIVFPVLHGLYGEDGTIQGMLELLGTPYVGCKVLASCVGMDKVYSKIIFEKAGIRQTKHIYARFLCDDTFLYITPSLDEEKMNLENLCLICSNELNFPVFVKPSNSGSSIGVSKAKNLDELKCAIKNSVKFDTKVLIEEGIIGKEVECAVLGNSNIGIEVSRVGEIISSDSFYSFDAKYVNTESLTRIPAIISEVQEKEIQYLAQKAFCAIDGNGLSRVDFFVEEKTGLIYLNEINTMPGFTDISMYPKLMEDFGYTYSGLLDRLIDIG